MYSQIRWVSTGGRPPRLGASGSAALKQLPQRCLIRGRLCTVASAELRAMRDLLRGGVNNAYQHSPPPACMTRAGMSLSPVCRKSGTVEFESRRQGNAARKPVVIQAKHVPRNTIGAGYPLVLVHRQKQCGPVAGGQSRDGPSVVEIFPEQAFFDGSRGNRDCIEDQRERALVFSARHL